MSQANTQLGEAVIKVRADLSALPGDLAAARKMAEEATTARAAAGAAQPGGAAGTSAAVDTASKAVEESTKTLDDHRQKVDDVADATERMSATKRNAREPVQQFTQSIRSQVAVFTGLIATVTAYSAALYAAVRIGFQFSTNTVNDQTNIRLLEGQYKKAKESIDSFNQARERTTSQRFPFQSAFNNIQAVSERVSSTTAEEFETAKSLREFEESPFRQLGRFWDMAMSTVDLRGLQTGQGAEFEKREMEAESAATRRRFAAEQFAGMQARLMGRDGEGRTNQNDNIIKIAEQSVVQTQIQGEMLKSQKFAEVTKPR